MRRWLFRARACGDTGWVCEVGDRPWGDPPNACQCGEPGVRRTQKREGECSPSFEQAAIEQRHRLMVRPQRAHRVK